MGKIKKVIAKKREDIRFGSERPSSPDFGKSRKDWKASKDAQKKRGK